MVLLLLLLAAPREALATNMPGGGALLVLGLVLYGFVVGFVVQLVFSVLLLLRLGRPVEGRGKALPVAALMVAGLLLVGSGVALGLSRGLGGVWVTAGWLLLLGWSLTNLVWALLVLARVSLAPGGRWAVRLATALLSLLLPLTVVIPAVAQDAAVESSNRRAHRLVSKTLRGHFLGADALVFADGARLVSASRMNKHPWPTIWKVAAGTSTDSPSRGTAEPMGAPRLCFVKDGLLWIRARLQFGHGRLLHRSLAPGGKTRDLKIAHAGSLACAPDGSHAVVGSELYTGKLTVLRFPGGGSVRRWSLPANPGRVAISGDGKVVAHDLSRLGGVHIRRVENGAVARELQKSQLGRKISSMALDSVGAHLAVGGHDGTLAVWATRPGGHKPLLEQAAVKNRAPSHVLFAGNPEELVATGAGGLALGRWSADTWQQMASLERWPGGSCPAPFALATVPGAAGRLALGCNSSVRIVKAETGGSLQELVGLSGRAQAVAVSLDGARVAAGGRMLPLSLFAADSGARVDLDPKASLTGKTLSLARSRAADLVAAGMSNGNIALFGLGDLRLQRVLHPKPGRLPGDVEALAFATKGRHLVSADSRGAVLLWSLEKRAPLAEQVTEARQDRVVALVGLPAGDVLGLAASGGIVRWRASGDGLSAQKRSRSACKSARALAVSGPAGLVAIGCGDGRTSLLASGTLAPGKETAPAHKLGVTALTFSPDGKLLITGGRDGRVLVWQLPGLTTGREVFSPRRKKTGELPVLKAINRLVFSPDGQQLAVATSGNHDNIHLLSTSALSQ